MRPGAVRTHVGGFLARCQGGRHHWSGVVEAQAAPRIVEAPAAAMVWRSYRCRPHATVQVRGRWGYVRLQKWSPHSPVHGWRGVAPWRPLRALAAAAPVHGWSGVVPSWPVASVPGPEQIQPRRSLSHSILPAGSQEQGGGLHRSLVVCGVITKS